MAIAEVLQFHDSLFIIWQNKMLNLTVLNLLWGLCTFLWWSWKGGRWMKFSRLSLRILLNWISLCVFIQPCWNTGLRFSSVGMSAAVVQFTPSRCMNFKDSKILVLNIWTTTFCVIIFRKSLWSMDWVLWCVWFFPFFLIAKGMWIEFHSEWEECLNGSISGFPGFRRIFLCLRLTTLCVA